MGDFDHGKYTVRRRELRLIVRRQTLARALAITAGCVILVMNMTSCQKADDPGTEISPINVAAGPVPPRNDAERERHSEALQKLAEFYGLNSPPDVPEIRWILPEEREVFTTPCLKAKGFTQLADGTWKFPKAQYSNFQLQSYVCDASYPSSPKYTAPLTNDQIGRVYDYTVERLIPCLEAQGYKIIDVPSRGVFISSYTTSPFYPFSQLEQLALTSERIAELEKQCPQYPPSVYLYGP